MNNPINRLSKTIAWAWYGTSVIGAFLASYGPNPAIMHVGKLLLAMTAGYVIFGLGVKNQGTDGVNETLLPNNASTTDRTG